MTSRFANSSPDTWTPETGGVKTGSVKTRGTKTAADKTAADKTGTGRNGGAKAVALMSPPQIDAVEIGSIELAPREGIEPAPEPSYVFSDQIGYLMRRAYQRHLAIFQQYACDTQLTAVQLSTLCALRDNGPSSQAELVRVTGVDQATIRGIIARLKARELIKLSPGKDDGRKVIAELTPRGGGLIAEMVPRAHTITERTLDRLNPAERVALMFLMRKLIDPDEAP